MSRPAAPESETPETDAVLLKYTGVHFEDEWKCAEAMYDLARSLERHLSLAQTEIKGHMRVKDDLEHALECERMKVAGCSTAAIGYWKEGDSLHPEYDCAAIHDVARLYKEYAEASAGLTIMTKIRDGWFKRADLAEFELAQAQARIAGLEKAVSEFVVRHDAIEPALHGVFTFYSVHGMVWPADKNWKRELDALRAALKSRA